MVSVDSSNNAALYGYGAALAGGAAGGYIGAKKAPSVLGKLDVDKILTDAFESACVQDKIVQKLGKNQEGYFLSIKDANIDSDVCKLFDWAKAHPNETVKVGDLKSIMGDTIGFHGLSASGRDAILGLSLLPDETRLTREELKNVVHNETRNGLVKFFKKVPKQTGKYALIGTAIGAAVAGFVGLVIGKLISKKQ